MKNKAFMLVSVLVLAACGCQSTSQDAANGANPGLNSTNPPAAIKPPWPPPSPNTMNNPPPSSINPPH
jgi:flagellar basal body L-ring protein FlgH